MEATLPAWSSSRPGTCWAWSRPTTPTRCVPPTPAACSSCIPDHSSAPDANDATIELNAAYRDVVVELAPDRDRRPGRPATPLPTPAASRRTRSIAVAKLADDTIGIGAPDAETFAVLLDACHRLGEVTYVEPGSGLIQVLVEFVDGPGVPAAADPAGTGHGRDRGVLHDRVDRRPVRRPRSRRSPTCWCTRLTEGDLTRRRLEHEPAGDQERRHDRERADPGHPALDGIIANRLNTTIPALRARSTDRHRRGPRRTEAGAAHVGIRSASPLASTT